jgi:uncharacterized protein YjdB
VAQGTATITATSEGKSGSSTVSVTPVPVATVTVAPSTATIASGSTATFTPTLKDANGVVLSLTGRIVTWTSSNTAVATVSASGVATGLVVGTTTITATSDGKSGSATLNVTPGPVASVQVAPPSTSVKVNATVQLTASAFDANGNPVPSATFTWQSSDGTTASVNSTGLVTGKKVGTVSITATSNAKSGGSAITVNP